MKIKNTSFVITICLLFFGCNKLNDPYVVYETDLLDIELFGIYDPADINLDPTWDWTGDTLVNIYYKNSLGANISDSILMPWLTSGNPMAVVNPDINTEDGWVLAFKDFGTSSRHVDMPFFALYNKYRGTLRFFVYNAQRMAATYFRGELKFRETQFSSSALSFVADEAHSAIDSFLPQESQSVVSFANSYSSWINFDFSLANYDPNNTVNTVVDLNIYTINESQIILESSEFSLFHEYILTHQPGTTHSDLSTVFQNGQKYFKSFDDMRRSVKDASSTSSDKFSKGAQVLKSIADNPYVNAIPILGSVLGVVNSFIGGKSEPFPWQMLKFQGNLKLTGSFQTTVPRFTISFSLKDDGNINAGFYQPINVESFGVFNLQRQPEIYLSDFTVDIGESSGTFPNTVDYYHVAEFSLLNNNDNLIVNEDADLTLVSRKIKLIDHGVPNYHSEGHYVDDYFHTWNNSTKFTTRYIDNDVYIGFTMSPLVPKYIGIELIFKANQPTILDDEIVFMKVYEISN